MLAAGLCALAGGKEWSEARQPFLAAGDQVPGRETVSQFLKARRVGAFDESIGALPEGNALRPPLGCQPVMLIEADPR
jgi:hypothetical protein